MLNNKILKEKTYGEVLELVIASTPKIVQRYINHLRNRISLKEKEKEEILQDWEEAVDELKLYKKKVAELEAELKASKRREAVLEAELKAKNKSFLALKDELEELKAECGLLKIKRQPKEKVVVKEIIKEVPVESKQQKPESNIPPAKRLSPLQEVRKRLDALA